MEKQQEQQIQISGWRDLTLLQLGALLRNCAANRNRRLYKEWFFLVDPIVRADAGFHGRKGRDRTELQGKQCAGASDVFLHLRRGGSSAFSRGCAGSRRGQ